VSLRSSLGVGHTLPTGRFLVLISVRGWVDPRAIAQVKGIGQLKNPITSQESNLRPCGFYHSTEINCATACSHEFTTHLHLFGNGTTPAFLLHPVSYHFSFALKRPFRFTQTLVPSADSSFSILPLVLSLNLYGPHKNVGFCDFWSLLIYPHFPKPEVPFFRIAVTYFYTK
jgi:hypothetical protein